MLIMILEVTFNDTNSLMQRFPNWEACLSKEARTSAKEGRKSLKEM